MKGDVFIQLMKYNVVSFEFTYIYKINLIT